MRTRPGEALYPNWFDVTPPKKSILISAELRALHSLGPTPSRPSTVCRIEAPTLPWDAPGVRGRANMGSSTLSTTPALEKALKRTRPLTRKEYFEAVSTLI